MHQPVTEIEDRATQPDTPGASYYGGEPWRWYMDGYRAAEADPPLDAQTALTYSAVWACRRVISQTLASLNWNVFERTPDGRSRRPLEDDVAWMLGMQASPELNAFEFRQCLVNDALNGNGFAEIERTGSGRPVWLHRIDPWRVCLYRDELGRLLYEIRNGGKESTYLRPEDVFHLRGPSPDGLVGYSVIQMFRRSIGLGIATERYGRTFFERGPMPGGVLTVPAALKKDGRDELRDSFQQVYGGSRNAGRVVVLWGDMKFEKADLANDDAQFLQSRNFNLYDICRIYGVPPHKVAQLERATFGNVEHQSIEFIQDCLLPWVRRLEMEADVKLFGRVMMGRRYTRLDLDTLLRGDALVQSQSVRERVNAGLMTPNEGRSYFEMDPRPNGDKLIVQGAMATLDSVVNRPAPPVGPGPAGGAHADQGPGTSARWAAATAPFRLLLARAYAGLFRVEADKARRAANKGKLAEHVADFYGPANADHVAAQIRPVLDGLLLALGRPPAEGAEWAERLATTADVVSARELSEKGAAACEGWPARAEKEAGDAVNTIRGL
jgi:HK97 family phage portal protein